jgi:hypothetical protein
LRLSGSWSARKSTVEDREVGQINAAGYTIHRRARPVKPNLDMFSTSSLSTHSSWRTLPYHLCCQKIQKWEASPKIAIPVNRADDCDQCTLRISSGGAYVDALIFCVRPFFSLVSPYRDLTYNHNESVLFDSKLSWVDIKWQLSQGYSPSRKLFPGLPNRKDQNLSDNITDCEGRLKPVNRCTSLMIRKTHIS